ncbi:hypothetical protein I0C86_35685 [Plantactinospora sp. S1510]|uniref:Uncharacterized protein n=1 Tax=Plantactinospora alkalitolerans TaxID=2789879 RepID=A0ABS0H6Z6_9ACTN|nr:hypothetical protein [Plantactinospora alkalitolerans]MBF9134238.1 hypothetical protein [Plantactinospora alkalitolerans]
MWTVTVKPGARVKELRKVAAAILADLERAGTRRLQRDAHFEPWPPEFRKLGVASCWAQPATSRHPPGFYLWPFPSASWSIEIDEVVQRCEALLDASSDVIHKLSISGLRERHVVIIVTVDWLGEFGALIDGATPARAPRLPEGMVGLWIVTHRNLPIRAVYWLSDGEWRDVVVDQEQAEALPTMP